MAGSRENQVLPNFIVHPGKLCTSKQWMAVTSKQEIDLFLKHRAVEDLGKKLFKYSSAKVLMLAN